MGFDYYYGTEADQFSFIRIPKALLTEERFSSLSIQAKLLYGLLLDRMGLSAKNGWLDKENRVYIIYQISEIQDDLGFSKKKAIDYLGELENIGLVEKKRRGLGLPTILYVKNFISKETGTSRSVDLGTSREAQNEALSLGFDHEDAEKKHSVEKKEAESRKIVPILSRSVDLGTSRSVEMGTSRSVDLGTSRSTEIALQEVSKSAPHNNTDISKTNESNTDINHILSREDGIGLADIAQLRMHFRESLDIDILIQGRPLMKDTIEGMYELVIEIILSQNSSIVIAGNEYPVSLVKERFLKLDSSHLQYVLECLKENTTKVRNIKKYLLAALFNAPITIDSYYMAEVNHDMGIMCVNRIINLSTED